MKFEKVRILSDVSVCCELEIFLPWHRDVTTSPLYQFKFRTFNEEPL